MALMGTLLLFLSSIEKAFSEILSNLMEID